MRRWNGWGSDEIEVHLPPPALTYVAEVLGPSRRGPSADFNKILQRIPDSRLRNHPLVSVDPGLRLRHARGHSLPDWIALRFGTIDCFPDGVAQPASEEEVANLIAYANETGTRLIPYGGGTSVVGHINPPADGQPVLTVCMEKLRRMSQLDKTSWLATFDAGVMGPHLEAQLRAHGYTLGHFPQSFEYSTLGGWIATRSVGQQSLYYGRIEDLFAGGRMIAPAGTLDLPFFPASAAGPDLRQIVLGSEGRLGVITQATVRINPLPEREKFHAVFFPDWNHGIAAVQEIAQARLALSMLRLSNAIETSTTLLLAENERLVRLLHRLLRARGLGTKKCMLILGVTGGNDAVRKARRSALEIARSHGGIHVGRMIGSEWRKSRFRTPYLRNTLWDHGYAVDTLETSFLWKELPVAIDAIIKALHEGLSSVNERVLAFAHISHVYLTGASTYVTYLYRLAPTAEETLARWQMLKAAASQVIVAHGGTISHQHGIGVDHLPWVEAEKGELGLHTLAKLTKVFDPEGIMNPGKLVDMRKL
ncbi:MAG: FAD-binding oxidoreductase [Candidatus Aminicenantaceae bacterium]